jgi:electron transport complex protein RnfB
MRNITPEQLDAVLPQTQCGLCGHGGCMPYSEAMVYENADINLCPPGGIATMKKLGELLDKDATPHLEEMQTKAKPPLLAVIREAECIGCTKCIKVCPVDAIIGAAKSMHTIIADECTGCELCIPACPVDCIDLIETAEGPATNPQKASLARQRFNSRNQRIAVEKKKSDAKQTVTTNAKLDYINSALARVKAKKNS